MNTQSSWKETEVVKHYVGGGRASFPYSIDHIVVMLRLLRYNEKHIKSFIDLGTGDGLLGQLILEQHKDSFGYLIDFSNAMLQEAKVRMADYKSSVEIINGDISTPEWQKSVFKDESAKVDAIVSGYCIHHLSHERKFELYSEIYDRLSNNGIFINLEHVSSSADWGEMLNDEAFIDSMETFAEKNGDKRDREEISREYHLRPDKKDNILMNVEKQIEWLRQIGYKRVDIYFKSYELAVFSGTKL